MKADSRRTGAANPTFLMVLVSLAVLLVLCFFLFADNDFFRRLTGGGKGDGGSKEKAEGGANAPSRGLFLYCAAGMRYAMDEIVAEYQREFGVTVEVSYAGSNTLLSNIEVAKTGDLYLAADEVYVQLAREKGLAAESIPLANMRPVIAVSKENPKSINSIDDLLRDDVRVAIGNPTAAAIGKLTKELLDSSGHWSKLQQRVEASGVFKPTVNEVAVDVESGGVDAGIIWDSTVFQYAKLKAVQVPELDRGLSAIEICVLTSARNPPAALRFARFAAARDKGLVSFRKMGFDVVDGDVWAETPQLSLYAGAVNRPALEPVIKQFEEREGVRVNTKYNGCGILTAEMRVLQGNGEAFPDSFMACDVYYLETVQDLFEEGINVSDTDIVIAVARGNPKGIKSLADLAKPGLRVSVGQATQCTIGVLTKRLLEDQGLYDDVMQNVHNQTTSSALLVPSVTEGGADAALAYYTDTLAKRNDLEVIEIDSPLAKAVQPFSVARSSKHKYLTRRLFDAIARSRDAFQAAGFNWRLDETNR